MTEIDTLLVVLGGAVLVLALASRLIKRVFLSPALVALVVGVALGPLGLGVVPRPSTEVLEQVARVALALGVMAIGLHVTRTDLRENLRRIVGLLTLGMVGMWALTGLGAWLLLDLPLPTAFLLGAILTPTDPIVASTIVTGRLADANLPRWLRRTLQVEAGANDGLALPFVLVAAFLVVPSEGGGLWAGVAEAGRKIGLDVALGAGIGLATAWLLSRATREREIERVELLYVGVALALTTLGALHLLRGGGVLGVFVAALVFSTTVHEPARREIEEMQEAITELLVPPVFILFGAALPWDGWESLGWAGVAFAGWVLILRRLPVIPVALAGSGTERRGTLFLSWFGPLGVAAIYYAAYVGRFQLREYAAVFAAATLGICASVVLHGVTATPGVRGFAGRSWFGTLRHPLRSGVEESE